MGYGVGVANVMSGCVVQPIPRLRAAPARSMQRVRIPMMFLETRVGRAGSNVDGPVALTGPSACFRINYVERQPPGQPWLAVHSNVALFGVALWSKMMFMFDVDPALRMNAYE